MLKNLLKVPKIKGMWDSYTNTTYTLTVDYVTRVVCVFKIVAHVITPGCTVEVMWDFDLHREKCRLGGLGVRVSPTTCMASPSHNKQLLIPNR